MRATCTSCLAVRSSLAAVQNPASIWQFHRALECEMSSKIGCGFTEWHGIFSIRVARDRLTGQPRGFAFVVSLHILWVQQPGRWGSS